MSAEAASSFEAFFVGEFPKLVLMLTAWTGDRLVAEDLAQDALMQADRHWNAVR